MGVSSETYAELEALILEATETWHEGGPEPIGWALTWELYRQLDYPGPEHEHYLTSDRAIHGGEEPKPLYGLPVSLKVGAHHEWQLRFATPAL